MSTATDASDALASLSQLIQAAARLSFKIHRRGLAADLDGEIDHMAANLNHVRALYGRKVQP